MVASAAAAAAATSGSVCRSVGRSVGWLPVSDEEPFMVSLAWLAAEIAGAGTSCRHAATIGLPGSVGRLAG